MDKETKCVKVLKDYRDGFYLEEGVYIPPRSFDIPDDILNTAISCCNSYVAQKEMSKNVVN